MYFTSAALLALSGLTSVLAAPSFGNSTIARTCGSHLSDAAVATAERDFQAKLAAGVSSFATVTGPIPVYFHIIQAGTALTQGNVPDSQVAGSIAAMNQHYASTGLTFTLAGTTRTTNSAWFTSVGPDASSQTTMKSQLRQGGVNALNVYTVGFQSGSGAGLLGYSTFPSSYSGNPTDDGIVMLYSSVPGGSTTNYNQGKTLTHETGHWVGLYHVFQGGCASPGDSVSDTPPQSTATSGCPASQDSCSGGGVDSIHNYMDYSYDPCMTDNFTAGQVTRMKSQMSTYRGVTW